MKAIILNSGVGSRLAPFTDHHPKCAVRLPNGESLLARQMRLLAEAGIREVVITTGSFADEVRAIACAAAARHAIPSPTFVHNPRFAETNNLYSLHLAAPLLNDDCVLMHGDVAFDGAVLAAMLAGDGAGAVACERTGPLSEKDFKARVANGRVERIAVDGFGDEWVNAQPLYRLSRDAMARWAEALGSLVDRGEVGCYAEDALNLVLAGLGVRPLFMDALPKAIAEGPLAGLAQPRGFAAEIDDEADLERVGRELYAFDLAQQPLFFAEGDELTSLSTLLPSLKARGDWEGLAASVGLSEALLVCTPALRSSPLAHRLAEAGLVRAVHAIDGPNPRHATVEAGIARYRASGCDGVVSLGGGSAMDVAKMIALALRDDGREPPVHVAIPSTAGSGSESTPYAVMTEGDRKVSESSPELVPDAGVLDPSLLDTLPLFQRRATYLDAYCHAVEASWAKGATEVSRAWGHWALGILAKSSSSYLESPGPVPHGEELMVLLASNAAGKAIAISRTTAAHALSYGLTTMYGVPHGMAVALCLAPLWQLVEERDPEALRDLPVGRLDFLALLERCEAHAALPTGSLDVDRLLASVEPKRLGNFPIELDEADVRAVYESLSAHESGRSK